MSAGDNHEVAIARLEERDGELYRRLGSQDRMLERIERKVDRLTWRSGMTAGTVALLVSAVGWAVAL